MQKNKKKQKGGGTPKNERGKKRENVHEFYDFIKKETIITYSMGHVADIFKMSDSKFRKKVHKGEIIHVKVNGAKRIPDWLYIASQYKDQQTTEKLAMAYENFYAIDSDFKDIPESSIHIIPMYYFYAGIPKARNMTVSENNMIPIEELNRWNEKETNGVWRDSEIAAKVREKGIGYFECQLHYHIETPSTKVVEYIETENFCIIASKANDDGMRDIAGKIKFSDNILHRLLTEKKWDELSNNIIKVKRKKEIKASFEKLFPKP